MAEIQGYHHLSLSVTDLGRSVDWYRSALGLAVGAEIEGAGFRRTRLRSGDGLTLTLTAHDQQSAEPFSERRAGMDPVAFPVGGLEEGQELKRRFEELGVDHSEVKESASGGTMITLRDPDNIQLEVFGARLIRRWLRVAPEGFGWPSLGTPYGSRRAPRQPGLAERGGLDELSE